MGKGIFISADGAINFKEYVMALVVNKQDIHFCNHIENTMEAKTYFNALSFQKLNLICVHLYYNIKNHAYKSSEGQT